MSSFVSVAEIQQQQQAEGAYLSWNIQLPPHIDAERLYINQTVAKAVGKIAGLSDVSFDEYVGDQTAFEPPDIGGILGGDVAVAAGGIGRSKRASSQAPSLEVTSGAGLPRNYQKFKGTVGINRPEVTSRIATQIRDGRPAHKAWEYELNSSLKQGLRQVAGRSLVGQASPFDAVGSGWIVANTISGIVFGVPVLASLYAVAYAAELGYEKRKLAGDATLMERRWSVFPSADFNPDRYAVARIISTLPLVRYRK